MRCRTIIAGVAVLAFSPSAQAQDLPRPGSELDRVIGKDARSLVQLLGPPAQDIREGSARRLQFSNAACILDVYLYPPAEGMTPVASFTAARVPDGRDAERNSCIAALRLSR